MIALSVNGYVSLTGFREITHFSDAPHHEVNICEFSHPKEISKHHYCQAQSLDHSIIQLSHLMPAKSSETNWRMMPDTGDDDDYHEYRTRVFDTANKRNSIRSI